ncbi:MAG: nucleoside triphosphate pyrophosphohydrolase [Chlorobi bacterium]|nr:nucleoside triphosphate pyrophosphohydrolase [Chlorobiota bacterium]
MINRIVKMTFRKEHIEDFIRFTAEIQETIKSHEGCLHLNILQDKKYPEIFFTYSCWNSEKDLENYRKSEFFNTIWSRTKKWFSDKPQAWSTEIVSAEAVVNSTAVRIIAFERILGIMDKIRKECPWDSVQTNESLRSLTLEEAYELAEAVLNSDFENIKKELGDLFLHIIFYAKIAEEKKQFDIADVINSLAEKLIYRHPHVFGNVEVSDKEDVETNWEKLKLKEKSNGNNHTVLGGIPKSLPSVIKAVRMQEKARGVGFDWEQKEQVWDKVKEELGEFEAELKANDQRKSEEEFGDLMFAMINAARLYGIDPESALELTNQKFIRRFNYLEKNTLQKGLSLQDMTLDEMEAIWQEAKKTE